MAGGFPEWPSPEFYSDWKRWADAVLQRLNEELVQDYSEIGEISNFAVSLPPNGRWLAADGSTFTSLSFPELAQKLGTTFGAAPAGQTRLPNPPSPGANIISGIRAR